MPFFVRSQSMAMTHTNALFAITFADHTEMRSLTKPLRQRGSMPNLFAHAMPITSLFYGSFKTPETNEYHSKWVPEITCFPFVFQHLNYDAYSFRFPCTKNPAGSGECATTPISRFPSLLTTASGHRAPDASPLNRVAGHPAPLRRKRPGNPMNRSRTSRSTPRPTLVCPGALKRKTAPAPQGPGAVFLFHATEPPNGVSPGRPTSLSAC